MALKICYKTTSISFIRLSVSLFCEYIFRIVLFVIFFNDF